MHTADLTLMTYQAYIPLQNNILTLTQNSGPIGMLQDSIISYTFSCIVHTFSCIVRSYVMFAVCQSDTTVIPWFVPLLWRWTKWLVKPLAKCWTICMGLLEINMDVNMVPWIPVCYSCASLPHLTKFDLKLSQRNHDDQFAISLFNRLIC